jgi:hypothetical protein
MAVASVKEYAIFEQCKWTVKWYWKVGGVGEVQTLAKLIWNLATIMGNNYKLQFKK